MLFESSADITQQIFQILDSRFRDGYEFWGDWLLGFTGRASEREWRVYRVVTVGGVAHSPTLFASRAKRVISHI